MSKNEARIGTINYTNETTSIDITISSTEMKPLEFVNALAASLHIAIKTSIEEPVQSVVQE